MASRQQLVKLILQNLGVWQSGQDLPAEDYQAVNERLPYDLLAMKAANVFDHTDPDYIPDDALTSMAAYLSQNYITTFGISGEEKADVIEISSGGEQALRFMRVMDAVNTPIQIQSY